MAKNSSIIFLILGVIAFLGSIIFMYLLLQLGSALSALASGDQIPNAGVPLGETQVFAQQLLGYVNIGWAWAISVLLVSLGMIYYSAIDLWGKKKK